MSAALLPVFAENEDPRRMSFAGLADIASRLVAGFADAAQRASRNWHKRPDDLVERFLRSSSESVDFHGS